MRELEVGSWEDEGGKTKDEVGSWEFCEFRDYP